MRLAYLASGFALTVLSLSVTPTRAADTNPPTPIPSPPATPTATATISVLAGVTSALLSAINRDRARHGAGKLSLDLKQSSCSRKHSINMARLGHLTHDEFPMDICVPHTWAGENVGVYTGDPKQAALLLHRIMMNEGPCPHPSCPGTEFERHGHYLTLMNRHFTHVGIGLVIQSGSLWLTENFTD